MQIGVDSAKAVDHRRVFVVDRDEITRTALQFMLHDEVETHELQSLDAAYAKATGWKPDVLLLGIAVVREQGIGVLKEIRSKITDLKIILVVDSSQDPLVRECLQNGADSILTKPLTIEKTRQKVDMALGRRARLRYPDRPGMTGRPNQWGKHLVTTKTRTALAVACHGLLLAAPHGTLAVTMEERMEAMERRLMDMETRVEQLEKENTLLRKQIAAKTQETNPKSLPVAVSDGEVKALNDKVANLEKKIEQDRKVTVEAAKNAPKVDIDDKGLVVKSADENYRLSLRAYAQADGNFFMDDPSGDSIPDKFSIAAPV